MIDVINAYHYNDDGLGGEFSEIVPLFLPYYGCPNHLQINIYNVVEYYGDKVKETEYPIEIINAYYNKYGYLDKIEYKNRVYIFRYDSFSGEMKRRDCFDESTGATLDSYVRYAEESICSRDYFDSPVYVGARSYYIFWRDEPYFTKGSTPFLEIDFVDGVSASYWAAEPNKIGEKLYFYRKSFYFNKKKMREIAPYWRDYGAMKYAYRYLKEDLSSYSNYGKYQYNEIGLKIGKGVTLSESKRYAVKNNKYYEYYWLNY